VSVEDGQISNEMGNQIVDMFYISQILSYSDPSATYTSGEILKSWLMCLRNVKLDKYMSNEQCLYMIIYGGKKPNHIYIYYIDI